MRNVRIYNMLDPYFVQRIGYGYAWGGGVAYGIDMAPVGRFHGSGDGYGVPWTGDGYGDGCGYLDGNGENYIDT